MSSFPNPLPDELKEKRERDFEAARQKAATLMSPEYKSGVDALTGFARQLVSPEPVADQPDYNPLVDLVRSEPQDLNRLRQLQAISTQVEEQEAAPEAPIAPAEPTGPVSGLQRDVSGASYAIFDPQDPSRSVNLGAAEDPGQAGVYYPDYDFTLKPEAVGEAAAISQDFRESINRLSEIATESGLTGDLYTDFEQAKRALDIDRSAFPGTLAGERQFQQAQSQARRQYGTLAQRILRQKPEIFKARDAQQRRTFRDTDTAATKIQGIADRLISQSQKDEFRAPLTQEQAYAQAIAQYTQEQSIQQRLREQLQAGDLDPQTFAVEQEQARQPFIPIEPQQFARVQEIISQIPTDLPYDIYMQDGQARLATGAGDFEAVVHPGSPVPVAVVRSEFEKDRAESAGIPYITPGNPNVVQNRIRITPPGRGDTTTTRRGGFGLEGFDPQTSLQENIAKATEGFDEIYEKIVSLGRAPQETARKRDSYHKLARSFFEARPIDTTQRRGDLDDPNYKPVVRDVNDVRAFSAYLQNEIAQGNQLVQKLVDESGIDLENPALPQEDAPEQLDSATQRALDLYEQMTQKDGIRSKPPSKAAFREQLIPMLARDLSNQQFEAAQEQSRFFEGLSGADERRSIEERNESNYETSYDPSTGEKMYIAPDRTNNFNPEFELRPLPVSNGVVSLSDPTDVSHVAFDTPFILPTTGEPVTISVTELHDVLRSSTNGAKVGNFSAGFYNNPQNFDNAYLGIADYLVDKMPRFFKTNSQLNTATMQMLRRLGYKDNPGLS